MDSVKEWQLLTVASRRAKGRKKLTVSDEYNGK